MILLWTNFDHNFAVGNLRPKFEEKKIINHVRLFTQHFRISLSEVVESFLFIEYGRVQRFMFDEFKCVHKAIIFFNLSATKMENNGGDC